MNTREGYLRNVCKLVKIRLAELPEKSRQAVLAFDEIHLQSRVDYCSSTDKIYGPTSSANTMVLQGLFHKWRVPIWYSFDDPEDKNKKLSRKELDSIIKNLWSDADVLVRAVTCDKGPRNVAVAKEYGVNPKKPYFPHPTLPGKDIVWCWDIPHMVKLLRTHFLKTGFKLRNGQFISGAKLYGVYTKAAKNRGQLRIGFHLTEKHFTAQNADLQNVSKAVQLMSSRTAAMVRTLTSPKAKDMVAMADFIG